MKATTSLTALVLGMSLAGMAMAQTGNVPPAAGGTPAPEAPASAAEPAMPAEGAPEAATGDMAAEPMDEAAVAEAAAGLDTDATEMVDGRWRNAEGEPTFKIDGETVDFATFNGFRRYHAECHVCHGPDGEGSTYAPALKNSVLQMDYYDFLEVVASGRQGSNSVMPAFATNKNVWCYIDDIYVYLLAHGTGEIGRGRPAERAEKSDDYTAQEDSCMAS